MKTKTFLTLLIVLTIICIIVTILHFAYAVNAYQNCSVIKFVAKELW